MILRPALLLLILVVLAAGAGCGSSVPSDAGTPASMPEPAVATEGPAAYVDGVARLLAPPAEMSRLAAAQGRAQAPRPPGRADLQGLVDRAETERARLAALKLRSPALNRQRMRLLDAYDGVVGTMRTAVDPVSEGRRIESRRVAFRLLKDLQELPSAAA